MFQQLAKIVCIVLTLVCCAVAGTLQYEVIDLCSQHGTTSPSAKYHVYPTGLNNNGQAVGFRNEMLGDPDTYPYDWTNTNYPLPSISGLGLGFRARVGGINDNDDIVGTEMVYNGRFLVRCMPFVYRNGQLNYINLPPGIPPYESQGCAINNKGTVAGSFSGTEAYDFHAFVWNTATGLEILPRWSDGSVDAINDNGWVVGRMGTQAFLYKDHTVVSLNGPEGTSVEAYDINSQGTVVGTTRYPSPGLPFIYRPFIYDQNNGRKLLELNVGGEWEGEATAINDSGQIVGWYTLLGQAWDGMHLFLYEDGQTYDLASLLTGDSRGWRFEDPSWFYSGPVAINNGAQILCNGFRDGVQHMVLLNPVPEPAVLLTLAAGYLGLRRRAGCRGRVFRPRLKHLRSLVRMKKARQVPSLEAGEGT